MLSTSIDWDHLFKKQWKKEPYFVKGAFKDFPISEQELMQTFKEIGAELNQGRGAKISFFKSDNIAVTGFHNSTRNISEVRRLMPSVEEDDIDIYLEKLTAKEGYEEFCLFINDIHEYETIWNKVRPLLKVIVSNAGLPTSGISSDFFMGNYSSTGFGAHKDLLDNFMIMLKGEKTMLLWHEDIWKNELGNPIHPDYRTAEYEPFRKHAQSFTLEAGDFLYWPEKYWHVGENDPSQISASINLNYLHTHPADELDIVVKRALRKQASKAFQQIASDSENGESILYPSSQNIVPENLTRSIDSYHRLIAEDDIRPTVTKEWLKKRSCFGALSCIGKRPLEHLAADQTISFNADYPILYTRFEDEVFLAHSGNITAINYFEGVEDIIDSINKASFEKPIQAAYESNRAVIERAQLDLEEFNVLVKVLIELCAIQLKS